MACLSTDNYVGEGLLNERDALIDSGTIRNGTRVDSGPGSFCKTDIGGEEEVRADGSAWLHFARQQMRHGRLNTSALLHHRVARHVDPERATVDPRHDLIARLTAYLNKALQQAADSIDDGDEDATATGIPASGVNGEEPNPNGELYNSANSRTALHVEISAHLGDLLLSGGYVTQAIAHLERASANCDHVTVRAWALSRLAVCLFLESKYIRAQRLFETSHSLLQNVKGYY